MSCSFPQRSTFFSSPFTPSVLILLILFTITFSNSIPIIFNLQSQIEEDHFIIEYSVYDADSDSLSFRLAFADNEIDLDNERVKVSPGRIEIPIDLIENPDLPPHLLAYDGTGYGGEYIKIEPAENAVSYLARFETTNLEFASFVEDGAYEIEKYWIVDDGSITVPKRGWNFQGKFGWLCPAGWKNFDDPPYASDTIAIGPFHPVTGISWWECWAYCKWANTELPTEEKWRAASQLAPNIPGNFHGDSDGFAKLAPTGSYPTTNFADLAGNIWEWLTTVRDVPEYQSFTCAARALCGGSWKTPPNYYPDYRYSDCPLHRAFDVGLRTTANISSE